MFKLYYKDNKTMYMAIVAGFAEQILVYKYSFEQKSFWEQKNRPN